MDKSKSEELHGIKDRGLDMPDVLEMPYRPQIIGAGELGVKVHDYRLGGLTCLVRDVIGDYSFEHPLVLVDLLIYLYDPLHYGQEQHLQRGKSAFDWTT